MGEHEEPAVYDGRIFNPGGPIPPPTELQVWHTYEAVGEGDGVRFSIDVYERDALARAAYWARWPGCRVRKVRHERPMPPPSTRTVVEDPVDLSELEAPSPVEDVLEGEAPVSARMWSAPAGTVTSPHEDPQSWTYHGDIVITNMQPPDGMDSDGTVEG